MTNTAQITTGSKVRLSLPNWDTPGCVIYTVELIAADEAIIREPKIPGLKGLTQVARLDQLVAA